MRGRRFLGLATIGVTTILALARPAWSQQPSVNSHSFAVAARGAVTLSVLFDGSGQITGPNPAFQGSCGSPLGLCVQCDIRSVVSDEIMGKVTFAVHELPATAGDSFIVKGVRRWELPGGTITTPLISDYHSVTSDPPKHGGSKAYFVGYNEDGAIATGTGRYADAQIRTEMRGRMETIDTPIGPIPIWFSHLFLIKVN
jgi:hypothetical protein